MRPWFSRWIARSSTSGRDSFGDLIRMASRSWFPMVTTGLSAVIGSCGISDTVRPRTLLIAAGSVITSRPANAACHNNLGIVLKEKKDLDGAVAAYREAIRRDPGYAPAHYNLGIALHDTKDVAGAIAAFKEAIRLDPKEARYHSNLGIALRRKGDPDGAIACFREAIRLDPKYAHAHKTWGQSCVT